VRERQREERVRKGTQWKREEKGKDKGREREEKVRKASEP